LKGEKNMKMESMVQYLENRGFAVTKKYDSTTAAYLFRIEKDGHVLRSYFEYPEEYRSREEKQIDFLESMVKEFTYHFENEKESNMKSNDLVWAIADFRTDIANPDEIEVVAELRGYFPKEVSKRPKTITVNIDAFKKDVLNRLNAPETTYNPARDLVKYCRTDVETTNFLYKQFNAPICMDIGNSIKDVIFNPPATIVFWKDNTKTVVKAQNGESYDPEKGLAMAMCKKMLGNKGNYFNVFRKWTEKYYEGIDDDIRTAMDNFFNTIKEALASIPVIAGDGNPPKKTEKSTEDLPWKIWYHKFDTYGNIIEFGVHNFEYKHKSSATRKAKKLYDKNNYEWIVSKTNPFINDLSE
jgi:hypothetical protein